MTLDELQRRDDRIAALDALGRGRSPEQQDEYGRLTLARDNHWRRLPAMRATALRRAAELEAYARQHRLPLEHAA